MQPLKSSNFFELLLFLLRRRVRRRIVGRSMVPLLMPGDEILIDPRAYLAQPPHPDDLVWVADPRNAVNMMVKRVLAVEPDGSLFIVGLNRAESTDSRHFGTVTPEQVAGRVTSLFSKVQKGISEEA